MLTYHHYTMEGDGSAVGFENNKRLLKAYKSHRDASIFDGKYIMQMLCKSCGLINISVKGLINFCLVLNSRYDNERVVSCIN
jgi:hypothetical protein